MYDYYINGKRTTRREIDELLALKAIVFTSHKRSPDPEYMELHYSWLG